MQKKLIALAVATLASGAAFAQTSVTFGGIVDMGYQYSSSHTADNKNQNAINDGGQDASRLFWEAKEDLGNGLSVSAYQQFRMAADVRSAPAANKSILTLAGKSWGAIRAGNYGSVSDDINGFSESGGMGWGNGALDMITNGTNYNVAGYVSPNFNGFQAKVNYSTHDKAEGEAADNGDSNIRMFGINGAYVANGLKLGASYQVRSEAETIAFAKQTEWMLSGGYDFGMFKIGAGYDREKVQDTSVRKAWRVTGGFAITPRDQVALSYTRVTKDFEAAADQKQSGWGLSYSHMMSKRTNVYASYRNINQNDAAEAAWNNYESQFKVGLRHQF